MAFIRAVKASLVARIGAFGVLVAYDNVRHPLPRRRMASVSRRSDARSFAAAKPLAVAGLALMFVLYFVGFLLVGGEWLAMWQSSVWNGQAAAVRFLTCGMLVLIVLMLPDGDARA